MRQWNRLGLQIEFHQILQWFHKNLSCSLLQKLPNTTADADGALFFQ